MCDIYMDTCRLCGKEIPMHLGDYATDRGEIVVYHLECFNKLPAIKCPYVVWTVNPEKVVESFREEAIAEKELIGDVVVVALTENAWSNWPINHPNLLGVTVKEIHEVSE